MDSSARAILRDVGLLSSRISDAPNLALLRDDQEHQIRTPKLPLRENSVPGLILGEVRTVLPALAASRTNPRNPRATFEIRDKEASSPASRSRLGSLFPPEITRQMSQPNLTPISSQRSGGPGRMKGFQFEPMSLPPTPLPPSSPSRIPTPSQSNRPPDPSTWETSSSPMRSLDLSFSSESSPEYQQPHSQDGSHHPNMRNEQRDPAEHVGRPNFDSKLSLSIYMKYTISQDATTGESSQGKARLLALGSHGKVFPSKKQAYTVTPSATTSSVTTGSPTQQWLEVRSLSSSDIGWNLPDSRVSRDGRSIKASHDTPTQDQGPRRANPTVSSLENNYTRTGRITKAKKGLKVYNCECGRSYTREAHLKRHQKNHGTDAFVCDWSNSGVRCGKIFYRLDLLLRHRERHLSVSGPTEPVHLNPQNFTKSSTELELW